MKKNFKEMASVINNSKCETNKAALNQIAKGAIQEIKSLSPLYFVNQLNKLAKKNEFIEGVNISVLGKMLQQIHGEKQLFTLHVFTPDYLGRPCYLRKYKGEDVTFADLCDGAIVCDAKGNEIRLSVDNQLVVYRAVTLSLSGMIQGFRAILSAAAADQDKAERDAKKAADKKVRDEKAARTNEFAKRVKELRENVASGIISADTAAAEIAIMLKAAI